MKTCFKCDRLLPVSEFYRHPMMGDGHLGKCKQCTKRDVRENYERRRGQYLAYERSRANAPHRVDGRKRYSKTENGKACHRRALRRQREKFPEKHSARVQLRNAVRSGRVEEMPCVKCGKKADGHHEDYSKPLDVVWLCRSHHAERHRELKGGR